MKSSAIIVVILRHMTVKKYLRFALLLNLCLWVTPSWSQSLRDLLEAPEQQPSWVLPGQLGSFESVMLIPTGSRNLYGDVPWVVFEPRVHSPKSAPKLHDRPFQIKPETAGIVISDKGASNLLRFHVYFVSDHTAENYLGYGMLNDEDRPRVDAGESSAFRDMKISLNRPNIKSQGVAGQGVRFYLNKATGSKGKSKWIKDIRNDSSEFALVLVDESYVSSVGWEEEVVDTEIKGLYVKIPYSGLSISGCSSPAIDKLKVSFARGTEFTNLRCVRTTDKVLEFQVDSVPLSNRQVINLVVNVNDEQRIFERIDLAITGKIGDSEIKRYAHTITKHLDFDNVDGDNSTIRPLEQENNVKSVEQDSSTTAENDFKDVIVNVETWAGTIVSDAMVSVSVDAKEVKAQYNRQQKNWRAEIPNDWNEYRIIVRNAPCCLHHHISDSFEHGDGVQSVALPEFSFGVSVASVTDEVPYNVIVKYELLTNIPTLPEKECRSNLMARANRLSDARFQFKALESPAYLVSVNADGYQGKCLVVDVREMSESGLSVSLEKQVIKVKVPVKIKLGAFKNQLDINESAEVIVGSDSKFADINNNWSVEFVLPDNQKKISVVIEMDGFERLSRTLSLNELKNFSFILDPKLERFSPDLSIGFRVRGKIIKSDRCDVLLDYIDVNGREKSVKLEHSKGVYQLPDPIEYWVGDVPVARTSRISPYGQACGDTDLDYKSSELQVVNLSKPVFLTYLNLPSEFRSNYGKADVRNIMGSILDAVIAISDQKVDRRLRWSVTELFRVSRNGVEDISDTTLDESGLRSDPLVDNRAGIIDSMFKNYTDYASFKPSLNYGDQYQISRDAGDSVVLDIKYKKFLGEGFCEEHKNDYLREFEISPGFSIISVTLAGHGNIDLNDDPTIEKLNSISEEPIYRCVYSETVSEKHSVLVIPKKARDYSNIWDALKLEIVKLARESQSR